MVWPSQLVFLPRSCYIPHAALYAGGALSTL